MSEKNKKKQEKENSSINYYELKTDAVNRLVNADSLANTEINGDPGREYRSKGFLDKIPGWAKALFIKFWFNGAVCFFIFWGLSMFIADMLDMMIVFGVVLGLINDLLVNNTFRFIENYPGQNSKWMMFPKKSNWTIFANIPYSMLVLFCVFYLYNFINYVILGFNSDAVMIGVEPIAFGLLYLVVDMFFVSIKNMIQSIITDAMEQNKK